MAFIDSPRVKQLIQQISDETISIADFLAASMEQNSAIKETVKHVLNALIREGIDVDAKQCFSHMLKQTTKWE